MRSTLDFFTGTIDFDFKVDSVGGCHNGCRLLVTSRRAIESRFRRRSMGAIFGRIHVVAFVDVVDVVDDVDDDFFLLSALTSPTTTMGVGGSGIDCQ